MPGARWQISSPPSLADAPVSNQHCQDVGCALGDQLSSYLNDFGCPISHGQWTAETSREA